MAHLNPLQLHDYLRVDHRYTPSTSTSSQHPSSLSSVRTRMSYIMNVRKVLHLTSFIIKGMSMTIVFIQLRSDSLVQ